MREADCVWSKTAAPAPKRTGRKAIRAGTEVRQAWLDRRRVHGEESVAFSGSIAVELDGEKSIVSTCTEAIHKQISVLGSPTDSILALLLFFFF